MYRSEIVWQSTTTHTRGGGVALEYASGEVRIPGTRPLLQVTDDGYRLALVRAVAC